MANTIMSATSRLPIALYISEFGGLLWGGEGDEHGGDEGCDTAGSFKC